MTLKQKLLHEYKVAYTEWYRLDCEARNNELGFGESVANAHRRSELNGIMAAIERCLSLKDARTLLPEIHYAVMKEVKGAAE